jgi:hypothetical protein
VSLKSFVSRIALEHRKRRMPMATIEIPSSLGRVRRILVCLPGGLRELTLIKQFLPTIRDIFRPASVTLLSHPGATINDMYPKQGFQILSPTLDQTTWSGLPKAGYVKILKDCKFDMVLDMNLDRNPFTSAVLLSFPDAIRVGRGNHLGEPYYNLEIKTKYLRDERNIYKSLLHILGAMRESTGSPDHN